MNILNKNLSLKLDMIVTLINGVIVIGGIFILNGLIARLHGLEVLGEFLLVKRTISSSMGILLIGLNGNGDTELRFLEVNSYIRLVAI